MSDSVIEGLRELPTATISDALDRLGIVGQCLGIARLAQDTTASREAAADRYLKAVPTAKMLDDTFKEMSKLQPRNSERSSSET